MEAQAPRFIADTMLGRLARWLRILGCDVEYFPRIPDDALAERVAATGRILLTRDTLLVQRRKVRGRCFFVQGDRYADQVRQVVERFGLLEALRPFSRCVCCNVPLEEIPRAAVEGRVPPYVFRTQERFAACRGCGRLFWPATHHEAMRRHLAKILGAPPA